MGTVKKSLIAVVLTMAAVFCVYAQADISEENISLSQSIDENAITFNEADVSLSGTQMSGPSTLGLFIRMIVVLVLVVAVIYGIFWFIRKKTNVVKTDDEFLRRAAYLNIAPGKTVEVITLIDKAYLIGVTEDNISLLGEIQDKELIQAMNLSADKKQNTKKATTFEEVLNMFMGKGAKTSNVFTDSEHQVDNLFTNISQNTENNE